MLNTRPLLTAAHLITINPTNTERLVVKKKLSNGMTIFDFDEDAIIAKMERMMELLDSAL